MIGSIILIVVFVASGVQYSHLAGKFETTGESERERQTLPAIKADNLFFAQDFDSISMYGDPRYWDDEKDMSVDTNGDDRNDLNFAISASTHEGIDLKGSAKQHGAGWKSMNFWSADLYRLLWNSLKEQPQTIARPITGKDFLTMDFSGILSLLKEGKYITKGSSITEDDYVQISVCDIDQDGMPEVLASVGNQLDENITAIYEVSYSSGAPFRYSGHIACDTLVEYKGDRILWAYHGDLKDGSHDTYIYDGKRIKKISD
jgi:hypothetical protein